MNMQASPIRLQSTSEPIIRLENIARSFGALEALRGISFSLVPGRALALVGESGCGKTTCARIIARMDRPTAGTLSFHQRDITQTGSRAEEKAYRRAVQMVFQDPFASLNPVFSIGHHLARPLLLHGHAKGRAEAREGVMRLLESVGLDPALTIGKFPHQLSGGQRQRVNIARAIAVGPQVLLADEPTSMLDVSIRQGILDLLAGIKKERNLALLYITHDIATAAHVAEEIVVMFAGQTVEWGDALSVITDARHPYTRLLLQAVPDPDRPFAAGESSAFLRHAENIRLISRPFSAAIEQVGANHFVRTPGSQA